MGAGKAQRRTVDTSNEVRESSRLQSINELPICTHRDEFSTIIPRPVNTLSLSANRPSMVQNYDKDLR